MAQIRCGGFSDPFDPFEGLSVDPDAPGLQLHVDKLAPGQENQWVAGAVWGQSADAPDEAPVIAGGAIAWTDSTQTHHTKQWDHAPLPEDPRPQRQPFGYFKPKWAGEGCFIGHEFFPLEQGVDIGNPTADAEPSFDLPPGMVIVPEAIAGLSRYDFTNGVPHHLTPQGPSRAGTTTVKYEDTGETEVGACDEAWVTHNLHLPEYDYDLPQVYGVRYSRGQIVFEKFHQGRTVAQVRGDRSRPQADPLTRPPQVGDKLAIRVNHGYFYQPAVGPYFTGAFETIVDISGWPAGTWEFWVYTVPPTGEKEIEEITPNTTQNYGVAIAGTENQDISRTGEIAQLLWHYGEPTLLKGTWSVTRSTTRTGTLRRPPGDTGPANGDTDSPGGAGYPSGWPSAADAAAADAGFFKTVEANLTAAGYFRPIVKDYVVTWSPRLRIPPVVAPHYTSEWVPNDQYPRQVTYDTRKGRAPRFIIKESTPYKALVGRVGSLPGQSGAPFARIAYEGRGGGITSHTMIGPSPPCWIEIPDPQEPPRRTAEGMTGYCTWVKGPKSSDGQCDVYVQWCQPRLIESTFVTRWLENKPGRAPVEPIPKPDDFSNEPGSAVPGGGGDPGAVPPEFGFPPGIFPEGSWKDSVAEETEYEIQSAVGPTLRSRRHFKSTFTESSDHSADWNGARSNSSLTATPTRGSYTLEYVIPVPMVSRSPVNSASETPEEALFLVRTLASRTQGSPFTKPYPYDTQVVFYQKAGGEPVAIAEEILDLFPAIAWEDPEDYQWSRQCQIRDGVLYRLPGPTGSADYRSQNATVTLTAYRVNDGSLSPINEVTRKIKSLKAPSAVVYDTSSA